MKFAIAIDGPAGAGKSSVAKAAAKALGFIYVDTGALYRTVGLYMLRNKVDPDDLSAVEAALKNITVDMKHEEDGQHVFLCGEDVTGLIRTPEVSMAASNFSKIPAVRSFLLSTQIDMAERYDVLMDGRDIGTVVLPNAQVKIFLTASAEERAHRRYLQNLEKGDTTPYEQVLVELNARDHQDMTRKTTPLRRADDAVLVDSTEMTQEETIEAILKIVEDVYGKR